jgi:excisionase family DNA binding protein
MNACTIDSILTDNVRSEIQRMIAPLEDKIEHLESRIEENTEQLMTKKEVAEYIGVNSLTTIDNYVKQGLPKIQITKRKVRFNRKDVTDFLEKHKA